MKQVKQQGSDDCFSACVASILELDLGDVPLFVASNYAWLKELREWLRPINMSAIFVGHRYDDVPDGLAILTTFLPSQRDHAVVTQHGHVIWDPGVQGRALGVPKFYTVFTVLDPSKLSIKHPPR